MNVLIGLKSLERIGIYGCLLEELDDEIDLVIEGDCRFFELL